MEQDGQFSGDSCFSVQNTDGAYGSPERLKQLLLDEINPTQY